jgi:hypothetical protein
VAAILLGLSALTTICVGEKSYDDAFITFRYARNLASGEGFVYNPGEPFLGTTTPLFTMALALSARIAPGVGIPHLGQWLTGASLFFCGLLVYLLARDDGISLAGSAMALLTVTHPLFLDVWGGEALLFLAVVLAAFLFYFREQPVRCGVLFGLAFLTRPEGVLPALVLSTHFVIVNKRFPWRMWLAGVVVVGPWIAYSFYAFGSPLPATLQTKLAQMDSGRFAPFLSTSFRWLLAYAIPNPLLALGPSYTHLVLWFLAALGGFYLLLRPRFRWWGIMAWIAVYATAFALLDVPFYHWYAAPLALGGTILAGLGVQLVLEGIQKLSHRWAYASIARALLLLALALPLLGSATRLRHYYHRPVSPAQSSYTSAGRWLYEHTPPTATVGCFEIGFIGYYSQRRLVDAVGLTHPDVSERVAEGRFKWAYLRYRPDYLVINPVRWYDRIGNIRDAAWFGEAYRQVATIEEPGYHDAPLAIYEKQDDAAIPPPR